MDNETINTVIDELKKVRAYFVVTSSHIAAKYIDDRIEYLWTQTEPTPDETKGKEIDL